MMCRLLMMAMMLAFATAASAQSKKTPTDPNWIGSKLGRILNVQVPVRLSNLNRKLKYAYVRCDFRMVYRGSCDSELHCGASDFGDADLKYYRIQSIEGSGAAVKYVGNNGSFNGTLSVRIPVQRLGYVTSNISAKGYSGTPLIVEPQAEVACHLNFADKVSQDGGVFDRKGKLQKMPIKVWLPGGKQYAPGTGVDHEEHTRAKAGAVLSVKRDVTHLLFGKVPHKWDIQNRK